MTASTPVESKYSFLRALQFLWDVTCRSPRARAVHTLPILPLEAYAYSFALPLVGGISSDPLFAERYLYGTNAVPKGPRTAPELPPQDLADELLAMYWDSAHMMHPFLDKAQMDADYDNIRRGSPTIMDQAHFLSILNTIFALSCQLHYNIPISERESMASNFYAQARSRIHHNYNAPSLASVQSYLLRAQYLQCTDNHYQFWTVSGLASRTAVSLGLHLPETSERAPGDRIKQLLRRVWHGCVMLDRFASMVYGRPLVVEECVVPLPDVDYHHLLTGRLSTSNKNNDSAQSVTLFVESTKLMALFYQSLAGRFPWRVQGSRIEDLLAHLSQDSAGPPTGRLVLSLDFDLAQWKMHLPQPFRDVPGPKATGLLAHQSVILHQR